MVALLCVYVNELDQLDQLCPSDRRVGHAVLGALRVRAVARAETKISRDLRV